MKSFAIYRFIVKQPVMELFLRIEDDVKIKELAAKTGMTQGYINIILLEMQKEKLIERSYKKRHRGNNVRPSVYNYNRTKKGEIISKALKTIKEIVDR